MSEYKGTKGFTIQNYTTDPDNPLEGQVWYNETTGALKVQVAGVPGAWSTDANVNTARYFLGDANNGPSSAALGYSGDTDGSTKTTITESYNGTSWTEVNDVNTARVYAAASGTQTAALFTAGSTQPALSPAPSPSTVNESWNGTSWTEVNDINTARIVLPGTGTQTSSIIAGGFVGSNLANVETWNGTSWTEVNDINTARRGHGCAGPDNTSALIAGGNAGGSVRFSEVESWNGTSWTEVADVNVGRSSGGLTGTATLGLFFGGSSVPAIVGNTEKWNGTSWSETNDLNTARTGHVGGGSQAASIAFVGGTQPLSSTITSTELWSTSATPQTVTFTTS